MLKFYFNKLFHSPTLNTWASFAAKSLSLVIVSQSNVSFTFEGNNTNELSGSFKSNFMTPMPNEELNLFSSFKNSGFSSISAAVALQDLKDWNRLKKRFS